ncbi:MAG TPA: AAA family ATPase [Longimicrobium sp.]|nr:AAA family ATPase [Longimicrobium sp.]
MALQDLLRDLDLLVRSSYSLIVLETLEEDRAADLLRELADRVGLPLFTWSITRGIRRAREPRDLEPEPDADAPPPPRGDPAAAGWSVSRRREVPFDAFRRRDEPKDEATPYDTTHPLQALHHVELAPAALYHFRGLGDHLADSTIAAKLRDAVEALAGRNGAIVVTGSGVDLPEALRPHSTTVSMPLPRPAEYRRVMREVITELSKQRGIAVELEQRDLTRLLNALRGMGLAEARKVITRAILDDGVLSPDDIPRVLRAKAEAVARDGMLEFVPVAEGEAEVAGLPGLKAWLSKRSAALADPRRAEELGLRFPRGILLLGVPGCGKSLSAKMVAAEWGLPLLRLDPAALYDKYIGESEKNFRRALDTASRLQPAVLWIDEIEKALQGGGDADGGTSTRVLGTFLSWMQDRTAELFVVATANDVARLPPELLRKGRFDELFFVDLPGPAEREEILRLHLSRRKQKPEAFDLPALAAAADGFSGAEIEQAIVSALYAALAEGGRLTTELLRAELGRTRPLFRTRAEDVARLRAWAADRTVSAG